MGFASKLKEIAGQGLESSKVLLSKAGAKARDLGELGVLTFQINDLKGRIRKASAELGAAVYEAFAEKGAKTLSAGSPLIAGFMQNIAALEEELEALEAEYRLKGGNPEDLGKKEIRDVTPKS